PRAKHGRRRPAGLPGSRTARRCRRRRECRPTARRAGRRPSVPSTSTPSPSAPLAASFPLLPRLRGRVGEGAIALLTRIASDKCAPPLPTPPPKGGEGATTLAALARHGAAGVTGAVARLDAHVDHGDFAGIDRGDRVGEDLGQVLRLADRPEAAGALRAR